jgi:hypothetical protein
MAQTPAKRRAGAKAPASRKRAEKAPASRKRNTHASRPKAAVDTTAKLSEEVLETVEKSQRVAIEAVRKFVETVDHALPALPHGDGPTGRQEVVDSALEMADRLVHTQYEFIRKVIDSASKTLSRADDAK